MNKYTFKWNITPATEEDYAVNVPPFEVVARGSALTLTATADAIDEQRLREMADEVAHNLARSLSYEHRQRFDVTSAGYHVLRPTGQQSVSVPYHITIKPADVSAVGTAKVDREGEEVGGASGEYFGTVIPVTERKPYMEVLEKASVGEDIKPFVDFMAGLVNKRLAGTPLPGSAESFFLRACGQEGYLADSP